MTDTRVVLVRHGESFATVERFIGGPRSCRGLTDHGKEQARVLGERLARTGEITADVVVSSGYLRRGKRRRSLPRTSGMRPWTFAMGSVNTTQAPTVTV